MIQYLKQRYSGLQLPLQAYGKLPIYKDYISLILSEEAFLWREWLFERDDQSSAIPDTPHPFMFVYSIKTRLIVGIITTSSDGSRHFPFTVFVSFHYRKLKKIELSQVFLQLEAVYENLLNLKTIEQCYEYLKTHQLVIKFSYKSSKIFFHHVKKLMNQKNSFPLYLILRHEKLSDFQTKNMQE